ncbi:hypothetical protein [Psychrobacter sp. JB385]|uniref:hypothetical protein n=1 Tax=Psychrobacter sp. JB385 TaxID=1434841 RepID=UPI00097F55AE|nr:hypothetical protein [Psychrobacter sp. JB385]SJN41988.1 Outer membrane protein assembly factor YaeT precursor [Psychrobacter sp. JB385]
MKMELLSPSALKISTLTLAIAAASLSTTTVMAVECQFTDENGNTTNLGAISNGDTALACGMMAEAGGTNSTVAVGDLALALENSATAVGGQSFASGLGSSAIG